jgi:hypothetical protein
MFWWLSTVALFSAGTASSQTTASKSVPPLSPSAGVAAQSGFNSSCDGQRGLLEVDYRGRRLLVYAFASSQFKPYVRELYTLAGDNVLLDAPPDHLHHHGLMYAIRVNGINFWEERDRPGYERSVRVRPPESETSPMGLPQARFGQSIHWIANEDSKRTDTASAALLLEQRTITVTVDEAQEEVALQWQSDFQVGPAAVKLILSGSPYHGLGLRLPPSFDKIALHQNSENLPTRGQDDLSPARWSAVSGEIGDRKVTVALFGLTAPDRGLPIFFTMVRPFTYLSVTQGLDKAPIEHAAGDKFRLEYLLVVYPCHQGPDFLNRRYERWQRSLSRDSARQR